MQAIAPVGNADLLATGQRPLMKLEIYDPVAMAWRDISHLGVNPVAPTVAPFKNYLKDVSFASGGARMTPNPIAGQFSAVISNEGNIFHHSHPTSAPYNTYFQAGRKVRISLGGNYTGVVPPIKYWQRIIGYIDEPEFASDKFEFTIKGLDYMKVLSDMKFNKEFSAFAATPIDNYWGSLWTSNSQATSGYGGELYAGADAATLIPNEVNAVGAWVIKPGENGGCSITSQGQMGGYSLWELQFIANPGGWRGVAWYQNVCAVVAGTEYYVTFKYTRTAGVHGKSTLRFTLYDGATIVGGSGFLDPPTDGVWHTISFSFTPTANANLDLWLVHHARPLSAATWRIDNISIRAVLGKSIKYYDMSAAPGPACTGIYYVELDGVPQWPGKQKGEGWYYDFGTNRFWFDIDKAVDGGVNNLDIYYFTAQNAEDVVADILVKAMPTVYANRAAALAAMGGPVTGVSIDRVRFEAGSTYIGAVRMICERCNWRFYFNWNGVPVFVPAPSAGAPVFTTFNPQYFTSPRLYQNKNEIWNRIIIEGEKVAELVGWEDNMPSELKDEISNPASITAYGEHTKTIKNILFQDLASITAMCATLLAAYKDPKWYLNFETPYNAVPLELGDTVLVKELLDIALPILQRYVTHTCLIRDADVSRYDVTYKCELEPV